MTALEKALAAVAERPDDEGAWRRLYARLVDAELYLLLEEPPDDDSISPRMVAADGDLVALAFDAEERISAFLDGAPADFVAVAGAELAEMLSGAGGVGLGLNLDDPRLGLVLPAETLAWIALQARAVRAEPVRHAGGRVTAPPPLDEALEQLLADRLAELAGLADHALLAGVARDEEGPDAPGAGDEAEEPALLLAVVGLRRGAEAAVAEMLATAWALAAPEGPALELAFPAPGEPLAREAAAHGRRIPIPQRRRAAPSAPGMDPERPPILR